MTKPLRNPDVRTTLLPDGHVVLFNTKNDWAHTLNPLAAISWEFCDGENSIEQIIEQTNKAVEELDRKVEPAEIKGLINELYEAGLILMEE